jgi:hypothetical protein
MPNRMCSMIYWLIFLQWCSSRPQESSMQSLSKSAPHLVALLSRSATHARKINPFKPPVSSSAVIKSSNATSEYRPSSTASFLARLSTYKLTTYANKPSAIDAVAAAKCGWMNEGKDRLLCGICNISWILASKEGLNRDAGMIVSHSKLL